jgi:hypothetical protein
MLLSHGTEPVREPARSARRLRVTLRTRNGVTTMTSGIGLWARLTNAQRSVVIEVSPALAVIVAQTTMARGVGLPRRRRL